MTSDQPNRVKLLAAFFAIYFVWGTTYLAIKYAIETIPPFMMMGMRALTAGTALYAWGRLRGGANPTKKELPSLMLIGFLFFLVGHGVLAWAQKTVPSGVAALLIASEPVLLALFEPLVTKEGRMGKRTALGMLFGLAGIAVLVVPQGFDVENDSLLGSIAILIGTCSWASGAVYARVAQLPRSPLITSGLQLFSGGVFLVITSYLLGEWTTFSFSQVALRSWLGLAYLILFGSIITFSAYTWLLTVTTATRISTHTFVNPIVAMIVGWTFANEALTSEMLIATMLIIISVYLVLYRKKLPAEKVEDAIQKCKVEGTAGEP
ncbi:MAG: EamA family transporter [Ignavibacteriae bacterium]|nr:EamA family transporter [Ignavibacteriota bacterium]